MHPPCLLGMVTFNRIELTMQCLNSLFETTDPELYSLMIVDNHSEDGTVDYLHTLTNPQIEDIFYNDENLGTAEGLSRVWKIAYQREQHVGKQDNDVIFYDTGWLGKMLYVVEVAENVGLVGLKRRDLEEKPNHNEPFYRSELFTLPNLQVIEIVNHVMGTCWLVSNRLLNAIGALRQIGLYGLDDSIYCHRAHLADFLTVFVPDVAIEHIDPGDPKYPEYTQWKREMAGKDLASGAYRKLLGEYKSGAIPLFEPF